MSTTERSIPNVFLPALINGDYTGLCDGDHLALDNFIEKSELIKPVFVKIDVQGFELEVLKGSKNLIDEFDYIYVECSFIELYEKQALADEVITFLNNYSFKLKGVYNMFYDKKGIAVQADFLFRKSR